MPGSAPLLCPSPPHRAVLGLVRTAAAERIDPARRAALVADLAASEPETLVQIAFDAYVHVVVASAFDRDPALAAAVPGDLVIFFREMQAANLRRNDAIRTQLDAIGAALSGAGLRGLVLKGAAELLAPLFPNPAFRFLSDVDILLPEADLDRAVDCLRATGALAEIDDPFEYRDRPHAAPLSRPDWPGPVELHRVTGTTGADLRILPGAALFADARPSKVPGLDVPAPRHRLAHQVVHAQVHSWRHRQHVLSPRDALEFEIITRELPPAEVAAARALFDAPQDRAVWQSLDAARRLIFDAGPGAEPLPPAANAWAATALDLYGRPRRQRLRTLSWTARRYLSDLLFDPARRRHHLHQLVSPRSLRRSLAHHLRLFRRTR